MVSGYCGNKAATFPLQLLGFDVDVMNTVNFSNHTGYPSWTGEKATGEQLAKLFEGLQTNGLVDYTHILTVLDPVMGDNGQLYVQPDVIPVYRELIKFASAITPNQFEADKQEKDARSQVYALGFPTYDGYFTGTGDLFSALLVARLDEELQAKRNIVEDVQKSASMVTRTKIDMTFGSGNGSAKSLSALAKACIKVVATMKAVVYRTYMAQKGTSAPTVDRSQASSSSVIKRCELRLIQSKKDIEQPDEDGLEAIELRVE
ncbi:hypothetical protein BGZ51_005124 [Haplosporangium sp. Z 767]|nr:hypothetical protein BGZ51_005124 [Haplosporangium sp. Z 767]